MKNFNKKIAAYFNPLISLVFLFINDDLLTTYGIIRKYSDEINLIINKLLLFLLMFLFSCLICILYFCFRKKLKIEGENYTIQVEYGDIFKKKKGKKVINFDECFTTTIGEAPEDIKKNSICGQYLLMNNNIDIKQLIDQNHLEPEKEKSHFKNKERYESGKILPNGEFLLMSFARLDENGRGVFFSYEEYLNCLSTLWDEIDKYYGQEDVYIPILGSGITRIGDYNAFTQQKLLEIIIDSYKLSARKIKKPYKLHIICKKAENFSLNSIEF